MMHKITLFLFAVLLLLPFPAFSNTIAFTLQVTMPEVIAADFSEESSDESSSQDEYYYDTVIVEETLHNGLPARITTITTK